MLVVFDLDGTLVDSTPVLLGSHEAAWSSLGLPVPPASKILDLIGLPLFDTMLALHPEENATSDAEVLSQAYSRAYVELAAEGERLFEGVRELLAQPFRAAVATGKSQRGADRVMRQFGLEGRFEIVLGGDSVPRPKPHPDLLWAVMKATDTVASDLVMVGDTTYDLEMAQAADVRGLGVSWGHHSVDRLQSFAPVVESFAELTGALGLAGTR